MIATVARKPDLFLYCCVDGPGVAAQREALLAAHLAYVEAHFDAYAVAGPILDEAGRMTASLFLIRAASQAEADAIMAGDPYMAGGLYATVEKGVFRPAAGDWIGGKIW